MTEGYAVGIGAANIDLMGRSRRTLVMEDSNPGFISMSVGGVTHNICENAARLGARVKLITAVGDDLYGETIRRECRAAGIDTDDFLVVKGESSSTYLSLHHQTGEMAVALSDMGVLQRLTVGFLAEKDSLLRSAGAIVMDAGLPEEILSFVTETYGKTIPIFADPVSTTYAKKLRGDLRGFHTVKPNLLETQVLSGRRIGSRQELEEAAQLLLSRGLARLVVSLGKDGVYYRDRDGLTLWGKGKPMERIVNATGAGDAFMGGLLYSFLQGEPMERALPFAVAASRMAVSHRGTIHPGISREAVAAVMERDEITVARCP